MNRLSDASSPYLRQHAENPVDWWPWSEAAFAEAARRDVPVFLSIGYAACHWCHVMAHESFEDDEAAAALNAAFVCVKVDREERPDVDGIYMDACLAVHGSGGWPLTALLTPQREPFYVATYLPRESRPGRVGVLDLAAGAARAWRDDAAGIRASAADMTAALSALATPGGDGEAPGPADFSVAASALRRLADPEHGGFGRAPKFPTPHHAFFLLAEARRSGDTDLSDLAIGALGAVYRGGVYDQLGGGLHRYATDRAWLLPHFEKMLTDQALYALACTEAFRATGELQDAAVATLDYALRDLRLPSGLFATSEDADSARADGTHHEGAFYVWSEAQLLDALGDADAALARHAFGTTAEGTFVDEATGRRDGTNVLYRADGAAFLDAGFHSLRARLLEARATRPRPGLDDKALADGNGLMLAALSYASRTVAHDGLGAGARTTAAALLATFEHADGLWHRAPTSSEPGIPGLVDDYAFAVWGLLELFLTTFDEDALAAALRLHRGAQARFSDPFGALYVSEAGASDLIARRRSRHDGAVPAGASVHVWNGLRLGALTENAMLDADARRSLAAGSDEHPTGETMRLAAALRADAPVAIVAGEQNAADTEAMIAALRNVYVPGAIVALRGSNASLVGNPGQTMQRRASRRVRLPPRCVPGADGRPGARGAAAPSGGLDPNAGRARWRGRSGRRRRERRVARRQRDDGRMAGRKDGLDQHPMLHLRLVRARQERREGGRGYETRRNEQQHEQHALKPGSGKRGHRSIRSGAR